MPHLCEHRTVDSRCPKNASYNIPGAKTRLFCKTHSTEGMVIVKQDSRICQHESHTDKAPRASFNFPDQPRPIFCKTHALEGMVNLSHQNRMCKGCNKKQPSFGIPGGKVTHCSACSTEGMVDLVSNLCGVEGCQKNCTYGSSGGKATRCQKHASEGMCDVKNKKCVECLRLSIVSPKQPTYGVRDPTHCLDHKTADMTDRRHDTERCKVCGVRATYGIDKPTHCTHHKENGMEDLVSRMCVVCHKTQGVFGSEDGRLHCIRCRAPEMTNIRGTMCEACGERQPCFNFANSRTPRFCAGCQLDGMQDVRNKRCTSCQLFIVSKKPHLCAYCTPKSTLRQKTKEMKIVNYLQEKGNRFIHNKSVGFVCGNYRPDIKLDAGTHLVIVEIDEDQHRQYDEHCEVARMYNIFQAEGLMCVFIRYNPDVFRDGVRAQKVHEVKRLQLLEETIEHHLNTIPEEEMSVYRLFYNNPTGEYVQPYDIAKKLEDVKASLQE
jgi:hypothetical protein